MQLPALAHAPYPPPIYQQLAAIYLTNYGEAVVLVSRMHFYGFHGDFMFCNAFNAVSNPDCVLVFTFSASHTASSTVPLTIMR